MAEVATAHAQDLTGRKSFARNVLFSWAGYGVNLVAGFVLPRMVSDKLGQTQLGIWDFAWSMVGYLGMIELGIGLSVDRFLAYDRATGDVTRLRRNISSMSVCMFALSMLVLIGSVAISFGVVPLFEPKLGDATHETRWVVLFLGLTIFADVCFSVYWSAIVASHRWDLHNIISSVTYLISTAGMITAILLGGGLIWMAGIHGACAVGGHLVRYRVAYRVCPELHVDWRLAQFSVIKEQAHFAMKNLLPRVADMLVNQTTNVLLAAYLGPAALAVFSRPRALTKHVRVLVAKFSAILIPSASAMQAQQDDAGLRDMLCRRTEQASCLTVPALLWVAFLGGPFVGLWMGQQYFHPWLVPALSLGYLASLVQDPVWAIMSGLNRHGRIALWKLAGAAVATGCVALGLIFFPDKLVGAALGLTIPFIIVDGLIVPTLACRALGVPLRTFYRLALWRPLKVFLPAGVILIAARLLFPNEPMKALAVGGVAGGIVQVTVLYLRVLPQRLKSKVQNRVLAMAGRAS